LQCGELSIRRKAKFENGTGLTPNYVLTVIAAFVSGNNKRWRTGSSGFTPVLEGFSFAHYDACVRLHIFYPRPAFGLSLARQRISARPGRIWGRPSLRSNRIDGPHRRRRMPPGLMAPWDPPRIAKADGYAPLASRLSQCHHGNLKISRLGGPRSRPVLFRSGSRRSSQIIVANFPGTLPGNRAGQLSALQRAFAVTARTTAPRNMKNRRPSDNTGHAESFFTCP